MNLNYLTVIGDVVLGYSSHLAASREEGNVPRSVPQSSPSASHATTLAAQPFVEQEED